MADYTDMDIEEIERQLDEVTEQRKSGKISPYIFRSIASELIKELMDRGRHNKSKNPRTCEEAWDDAMGII